MKSVVVLWYWSCTWILFGLWIGVVSETSILSDIRASQDNELLQLLTLADSAGQEEKSATYLDLGLKYLYGNSTLDKNITRALYFFNQSATLGNPQGQYMWGLAHSSGIWTEPRNPAVAILNFYFASMAGEIGALLSLGNRHKNGYGVPKNCESAVLYYEVAAKKAIELREAEPIEPILYDEMPVRLSQLYDRTSKNPPKDYEVVDYFQYSANKGDESAMLNLGTLYYYGARGLTQDLKKAAEYFHKALDAGASGATVHLAHMYANGLGVKRDYDLAYAYYNQAIEEGQTGPAWNGLGAMYLHGHGTERDIAKAKKLFQSAAKQQNAKAYYNLGVLNMGGVVGEEPDYKAAAESFQMAAQKSHTLSMYYLGNMYLHGIGREKSCRMALEYFKAVAERGPWVKKMQEAHVHFQNREYENALAVYLSMAEQGYEVAQHNAAWMIDLGYSYHREDYGAVSVALYKAAAKQGNVDASLKIGDFYYYGQGGVPLNYEKAIAHYRQASKRHHAQAMFNLGVMQEHGIGLPQDFHLAKRWYDMSATATRDSKIPVMLALWKLKLHIRLMEWYEQWEAYWSGDERTDDHDSGSEEDVAEETAAASEKKAEEEAEGDDVDESASETEAATGWMETLGNDNVVLAVLTGLLGVLLYIQNNRQ